MLWSLQKQASDRAQLNELFEILEKLDLYMKDIWVMGSFYGGQTACKQIEKESLVYVYKTKEYNKDAFFHWIYLTMRNY